MYISPIQVHFQGLSGPRFAVLQAGSHLDLLLHIICMPCIVFIGIGQVSSLGHFQYIKSHKGPINSNSFQKYFFDKIILVCAVLLSGLGWQVRVFFDCIEPAEISSWYQYCRTNARFTTRDQARLDKQNIIITIRITLCSKLYLINHPFIHMYGSLAARTTLPLLSCFAL